MAKGKSFCPHCYRVVPAGQSCPCRNRDALRKAREPWRASYRDPEYLRNRQKVIDRQLGRCKDCGTTCAHFDTGTGMWVTAPYGGEVDHERPLCEGGTNDVSNLALRCKRCHGLADSARRKRRSKPIRRG
ncbi:MAG: HNH endonuclease [Eggerthellaceae bacterium]|nr:HNH endonuclease [Eggerthellaceae bacterium]